MAVAALSVRSRRWGRMVVAGALAAAALALPACGGGDASPAAPATPGGNVDPGATSGPAGVINKAKDTAGAVEQHDATLSTSATQP